ncbi:hypothetical protein N431DRAFT_457204 [Stipitochalara longipes BDJ]|nr:hypothetical protein N431DRAFT_457204 [Stipitochalara longipes BDJ]
MATNQPTTRSGPIEAVYLRNLPYELRHLIYPHELELQPALQAPPLLIALASEPDLCAEAHAVYEKINFVLTLQNHLIMEAMEPRTLIQIRHLTVVWEKHYNPNSPFSDPPLRAMRTLDGKRNNFETITFDLRKGNAFESTFGGPWVSSVKSLILGARGSVHKLTAVFNFTEVDSGDRIKEIRVLQKSFVMLGIVPKLQEPPKGTDLRVWTWEVEIPLIMVEHAGRIDPSRLSTIEEGFATDNQFGTCGRIAPKISYCYELNNGY